MSERLFIADVARTLRVAPATVRAYRSRGQFPAPDGHEARDGKSSPWWTLETVERYRAGRRAGTNARAH